MTRGQDFLDILHVKPIKQVINSSWTKKTLSRSLISFYLATHYIKWTGNLEHTVCYVLLKGKRSWSMSNSVNSVLYSTKFVSGTVHHLYLLQYTIYIWYSTQFVSSTVHHLYHLLVLGPKHAKKTLFLNKRKIVLFLLYDTKKVVQILEQIPSIWWNSARWVASRVSFRKTFIQKYHL